MKFIQILVLFFSIGLAHAQTEETSSAKTSNPAPLALVYSGKGACFGCELGAAKAVLRAGFRVIYVNENLKDFSLFNEAKVWVQPGGTSKTAALAMGEAYLEQIRNFVGRGGTYVGFCAGSFLATEFVGTTSTKGLGILPGKTIFLYAGEEGKDHPYVLDINWEGSPRKIYFNGGPYFDLTGVNDPNLKVIATYASESDKVAAVTTRYGAGHVIAIGPHPEHLGILKLIHFKFDRDGIDRFLATRLILENLNP